MNETTPDNRIADMIAHITDAINDAALYRDTCAANYNNRFCLWPGQSDDGRKWKEKLNRPPFPWDGASDQRIRLSDKIINEDVAYQIEAFFRASAQASARETSDLPASMAVTTLMGWVMQVMGRNLRTQLELLCQWKGQNGGAALGVFWNRELRLRHIDVSVEQFRAMGEQLRAAGDPNGQNFLTFLEMLHDPVQEEELVEMIRSMSDYMDRKEAKRILQDLQNTGAATIPMPYVFKNVPAWRALRFMADLIFPYNAGLDLQRAPWLAHRVWMSATDVEAKVDEEGWNEEFVERALQKPGHSAWDDWLLQTGLKNLATGDTQRHEDDIEILYYYTHCIRNGVREMDCAILHGSIDDLSGLEQTNPFKHGKYPFVTSLREIIDDALLESRGVPEIVLTQQNEIKIQRDSRTDRTSLATLPPVKVPPSRMDKQEVFGPGIRVVERRGESVDYMRPPQFDPGSSEIERTTLIDVNEYFGRGAEGVDPVAANTLRQKRVNDFLADMKEALVMTFQEMRQFLAAAEVQRITGIPLPWDDDEIEIQGLFDFSLTFDVRELDVEYVTKKMRLIGEMLPLDAGGTIDRVKLVQIGAMAIDPNLANVIVRDQGVVTGKEIEDEKQQINLLLNGIQPEMNPQSGQNFKLRLQTLQQTVNNEQIMQTLEQKPLSKKLLEDRVKFFQQQITQDENKVIGRLGVRPTLGLPQA